MVIQPSIFSDHRGKNFEGYNEENYNRFFKQIKDFEKDGLKFFVDSYSVSVKNVLRGFHGDTRTWKLIQCIKGAIYFVVIDVRPTSPTFHNHEIFDLNDKTRFQVIVPAGCANAHLCVSDECIFSYKLSNSYTEQKDQISIKWNDPKYNISWPITNPILSERDLK